MSALLSGPGGASSAPSIDVPWALTDEQVAWREAVATFADKVIAPVAAQNFISGRFPADLVPQIGELGLFGIRVSAERGGSGGGVTDMALAIEQLARVDGSTAGTVQVQAANAACLESIGSEEQVGHIIPRAASGKCFVAFGLTEPSGGSNARNMRTVARRAEGDWIINGAKQYITNSGTPFSEYVVLFAVTSEGTTAGKHEISAFLVPLDAPGVVVGPGYDKLGFRASDTRQLYFDDVRLPASAMLGEPGTGYGAAMETLRWSRVMVSALSTGLAQGCLDETVALVKVRESFGRRLGDHQHIAFMCAEIAAMVSTCRLLTYDAAWKADHGLPYELEASVAKFTSSELLNRVTYRATQLHGGQGLMLDTPVARFFADARVQTIIEGTSEMQRLLISRGLGL
jgi:short-chain 2-methylacyl-CoA dehydrogenase